MAGPPKLTRRRFLLGSAAVAGGVAFGFYAARDRSIPDGLAAAAGSAEGDVVLNPWLVIGSEGITVVTPRAEMGQGIHTTLAALVAEELDVPFERVRAVHGPAAAAYANTTVLGAGLPFAEYENGRAHAIARGATAFGGKFLGLQITGGSTSTIDAFDRMRTAGAAARETLVAAAAARLGVDAGALGVEDGEVVAPDGARLPYASLAADAARLDPPRNPALKPASEWRHLGRSLPRVDVVAKSTGTARYGIDARLPGMLYGAVRTSPRLGGEMIGFDATAASAMPGVERIVDLGDGVGVVATSTWRAFKAIAAVEIEWGPAPYPADDEALHEAIVAAFDAEPDSTLRDEGDVEAEIERARDAGDASFIEAEYRVPWLAHATMEPMNATAWLRDDVDGGDDGDGKGGRRLEIVSGHQAPTSARDRAATLAGLEPDAVTVEVPFLGGGFGRRAESDVTDQAVRLALEVPGRPVKLTWTREQDVRHDFYRPAAVARMKGVAGPGGPTALAADVSGSSVYVQQLTRSVGFAAPGPDKMLVEGAFDRPYRIGSYGVRGHVPEPKIPVGTWRSVGHSQNGIFHECFLDELIEAGGHDPIDARLALMEGVHEPSRACVRAVADVAGPAPDPDAGRARGVAFVHSFGSPTAVIVELSGSGKAGVRLERIWAAIDVGTALDPGNIEAQVGGGIVFGLSAAIGGEIGFADGRVVQGNFDDCPILRTDRTPPIEVRVLENDERMGGVGEPGVPPAAPALANAVSRLLGRRLRRLPLAREVRFA